MIEQRFEGVARPHHVAQKLTTRTSLRIFQRKTPVLRSFPEREMAVRERPHFLRLGAMEERETSS